MAIDPSIPLQAQAPGIMGAALGGLQAGQQIAANKTEMQKAQQGLNIQALKYAHDTAVQLKSAPIEQRAQIASTALPQLQKMGVDVEGLNLDDSLDDASLDSFIAATKPYTVVPGQQLASSRPIGNETIVDKDGIAYAQSRVFDPRTQKVSLIETALGPSGSITNRMGQTALEKYESDLRLKRQQEAYAAQKALEVEGGKAGIKLGVEQEMIDIGKEQEAAKAAAKEKIALEKTLIDQGVSAAENLPRLEETLDLMQKVNTGGFNRWAKAIADRFGLDTSNESLVQSTFSQNIVELLQQNKGTQTKADQELIEKTGPNFDLGSKSNIELLKRVVSRNKNLKQRAIDTAKKREEYGTALETLTRDYSYKPETVAPPKAATSAPKEVNWGDL